MNFFSFRSYRINFIYENNTWCILFRTFEYFSDIFLPFSSYSFSLYISPKLSYSFQTPTDLSFLSTQLQIKNNFLLLDIFFVHLYLEIFYLTYLETLLHFQVIKTLIEQSKEPMTVDISSDGRVTVTKGQDKITTEK